MAAGGRQIWAVSRMGKNGPSHSCDCLTCAQAGVRLGIVVKEKDVFHVSVRTNYTDVLLQFVQNFLVSLVICSEVETGNFTTLVYNVLLNVGNNMLKMTGTLWKNSVIIVKHV
jgi:hypothetical protein